MIDVFYDLVRVVQGRSAWGTLLAFLPLALGMLASLSVVNKLLYARQVGKAVALGLVSVSAGIGLMAVQIKMISVNTMCAGGPANRVVAPALQSLVEPLSLRKLDVLRLFPTELTGPELADRLVVALSTVRTNTKSIYGKLGVSNRRAAVRRAMELGLL